MPDGEKISFLSLRCVADRVVSDEKPCHLRQFTLRQMVQKPENMTVFG